MNAVGWGLVIIAYTAIGALWSGLVNWEDEPPASASPEVYQRWVDRQARKTKRVWIWQAGLALIMIAWWFSAYLGWPG
jgi:hypothetical protein